MDGYAEFRAFTVAAAEREALEGASLRGLLGAHAARFDRLLAALGEAHSDELASLACS